MASDAYFAPQWESFAIGARYMLGTYAASYAAGTPTTAAKAFFTYIMVPAGTFTITGVAVNVTTLQSTTAARLGIYDNTGGKPTNLLADFGEVTLDATGFREGTGANYLTNASAIWFCVWLKDASPQASLTCFTPIIGQYPMAAATISGGLQPRGWGSATAYPTSLPATAPSLSLNTDAATPLPFFKVQ